MGWPVERIRKVCGPVRHQGGRTLSHVTGFVENPLGRVVVAVHTRRNSDRETVSVGTVVNLTPEQADGVLRLIRAVEPYPPPAGRTEPGEVVSYEIGGSD